MKIVAGLNPTKTLPGNGLKSIDKRNRTSLDTTSNLRQTSIRVSQDTKRLVSKFADKKDMAEAEAFRRFLREGIKRSVHSQVDVISFLQNVQDEFEDSELVESAERLEELAKDSDEYKILNPNFKGDLK